jgi:hypothetical protein
VNVISNLCRMIIFQLDEPWTRHGRGMDEPKTNFKQTYFNLRPGK